jgi:hypothetical protein
MAVRHLHAIDPDRGQRGHAAQLQFEVTAMPVFGQAQGAAIPADAATAEGEGIVLVRLDGVGDGPVMRHAHLRPGGIVIIERGSALRIARLGGGIGLIIAARRGDGDIALMEAPAGVEPVERRILWRG